MSAPEQVFSVGEYVERVWDGRFGRVVSVQPYEHDGIEDFYYAVDLDPQRPANEDVWSGTTTAWRRAFRIHAHVSTESRDCDGRYTGGRVEEMTLQERCDQFGDHLFKGRVLASVVSLIAEEGTTTVGPHGFEWREWTDEGYRTADVRWCEDDCSGERSWQRDHTAESMGY